MPIETAYCFQFIGCFDLIKLHRSSPAYKYGSDFTPEPYSYAEDDLYSFIRLKHPMN